MHALFSYNLQCHPTCLSDLRSKMDANHSTSGALLARANNDVAQLIQRFENIVAYSSVCLIALNIYWKRSTCTLNNEDADICARRKRKATRTTQQSALIN